MGVSSIEERKTTCCLSPKIYQPPTEDMETITEFPRKKKMFSSSSFYEEPNAIYPTVEEQVNLCRKIAESLSDDCNLRSKGANMFFKRVQKAEKWIVAESKEGVGGDQESSTTDPTRMPYVRPSKSLTNLKLILDPRHLVDMKQLLKEGVDIVEHNAVSPDVCHDIVKDLNSPTGKGAQLFAKRKQKSEEWVVDEEKVKNLMQTRYQSGGYLSDPTVPDLTSQEIADSVIRAAEAKVMSYPNAVPQVPFISSLDGVDSSNSQQRASPWSNDAYKFRAPRGWTGTPTPPSLGVEPLPISQELKTQAEPALIASSTLSRSYSFANFNSSPRAWNSQISSQFRSSAIKPVKPPTVFVQ